MQTVRRARPWRGLRGLSVRAYSGRGNDETPLRRLLDDAGAFGEPERAAQGELQWATQPYAARQGERSGREALDPRETTVLLFPGQGAQRVGMGLGLADVPAARDMYEFASSVVGLVEGFLVFA